MCGIDWKGVRCIPLYKRKKGERGVVSEGGGEEGSRVGRNRRTEEQAQEGSWMVEEMRVMRRGKPKEKGERHKGRGTRK